jgi:hypothetical protein
MFCYCSGIDRIPFLQRRRPGLSSEISSGPFEASYRRTVARKVGNRSHRADPPGRTGIRLGLTFFTSVKSFNCFLLEVVIGVGAEIMQLKVQLGGTLRFLGTLRLKGILGVEQIYNKVPLFLYSI